MTVAMWLAYNKIIPPKEWEHKPDIKAYDINNLTVALILSAYGIIPPKEWNHNPNIKDKDDKTVEDYLLKNEKEVTEHWRI